MARVLLLALVALAVMGACAHGDARVGPVVQDLAIEDNEAVEDGDIKGEIVTQETSWFPLASKKRLDRNIWSSDLERIERLYRARGFYQAQVVDSQVEPAGDDAVRLRVKVEEGEPTLLSRVSVQGLEALPERHRRRAQRRVTLREGERFDEDRWLAMREGLSDVLTRMGYAAAEIDGEAKVDLATREAFIELTVTPGERYRPGEVRVEVQPGARVEAWRIEEQVLEAIEGEEWYSPEVQEEAQQRIFGLGVFGAARVTPLEPDPASGTVPLKVEATESAFHQVSAGVGVGIEQRRQEGHLVGEYIHRDFLGDLRRLQLRTTLGWAFIPSAFTSLSGGNAVTRAGPVASLDAQLEQPRLFHPDFRLRTELELERAVEPAFAFTGGRLRLGVPWRPRSWLELEPSYNIEVYWLSGSVSSLTGGTPQLLFGCPGTCVLSYLEQRIAWDKRDDPQEPRRGYYLALALQEGGGPLGGSFDYLRVVPEARGYLSFLPGRRLTFATRLKLGTLIPLQGAGDLDSPVVARFFSGGDAHRGFSVQRLSPMRLEATSGGGDGEFNAEPVPIGGNGLLEASFETRYALGGPLTLAAFVDTGFVTVQRLRGLSQVRRNLLWAVGTGVRYRTPVGPVRLDLAYRLPVGPDLPVLQPAGEDLRAAPAGGCFGLGGGRPGRGGAPEGVCSFHLSIGEAF